jgi:hypothetical protein
MPTDTLTFLPGDSASVDGWVVVTDESGRVMPRVRVLLSLLEPFGSLELLGALGDTTNENGRAYFRFHSFNQTGTTTIRAQAEDETDQWPLSVLAASERVAHITLSLSDSTITANDSVLVCAQLWDSLSNPLPWTECGGLILPVRCTGGRITPIGPLTGNGDSLCSYWYPNGLSGHFCLWLGPSQLSDTVCIDVLAAKTGL